jgi:hypothetical protein
VNNYSEIIESLKSVVQQGASPIPIERLVNGLKGITGTGTHLERVFNNLSDYNLIFEPGDFAGKSTNQYGAAPLSSDVWYLWSACNMMALYYDGIDGDHYDYSTYLNENLSFLSTLPGLKPLKVLRNLEQLVSSEAYTPNSSNGIYDQFTTEWANNGVYWINTLAFENWTKDIGYQYPSDGPKDFKANEYVGYISFPIGQLGIMETISLILETKINGYEFSGGESPSTSGYKNSIPVTAGNLTAAETPSTQPSGILIFPDMKTAEGGKLAGENYCYGKHLIESGYLVPKEATASNADDPFEKDIAPVSRDLELFSTPMAKYTEDVGPKKWMRYWIHKENTFLVPGEFVGILTRALSCAPHVWWFQESNPFLYAGNWIETKSFSSGEITEVTLEAERPSGSVGNEYKVKIQGCEVIAYSTDFFTYAVGERVAIIKTNNLDRANKSFTWIDQVHLKSTDKGQVQDQYIIAPITYYKANTEG